MCRLATLCALLHPLCAMSESPFSLQCNSLNKAYGQRHVLKNVELSIASGEYVAIMGDSGVGKSSLLNLIAGLDKPNSGKICIDGVDISALNDEAATLLRREKCGFIFQAFHLLPHLTLLQNIALPLVLNHLPLDRAQQLLSAVGLQDRGDDFPRQLSGGEMQRVAIARALVHQPRLLLADEPTGNLDPDTAQDILQLLKREIRATNASAILVTHSALAAATADRVLLLSRDGLTDITGNKEFASCK